MSKVLNLLTGILILGFSLKLLALESTDKLNVNILKVYNKNIIVLDRGAEDGIFKKDHIKITSEAGFIARAICVKNTLMTSHWKVYRVVRPELVSKDATYKLNSINQSEIPKDLTKYARVDFSKYLNDYSDKDVLKGLKLQQTRIAKSDLPTEIRKSKAYERELKPELNRFLEKNFENKSYNQDFNSIYFNIFASPIKWQSRDKQEEHFYGGSIQNLGFKYQYKFTAVEKKVDLTDPVSKDTFRTKATKYDFQFQINKVSDDFSIISLARFNREKIGNIYYPRKHIEVGVIGLRFHVWEESPKDRFVDISYIPIFDTFEYSNEAGTNIDERVGMRHQFQARAHSYFSKNLHNKTELTWSPFVDTSEGFKTQNKNTITTVSSEFSNMLSTSIWLDYKVSYELDRFRGSLYGIKSENTTQTLQFRYEWNL